MPRASNRSILRAQEAGLALVIVGLAIVISVFRHFQTVDLENINLLKG